jgi:hypothetical protein
VGFIRAALTGVGITTCLFGADKRQPNAGWAENYNIPLWDEGKVPLAQRTGPLDNPFLTVFLPPETKRNGGSVVIAPGGSNIMLMYGAEGLEIAERFNDWGFTAFVLTYVCRPDMAKMRVSLTANEQFSLYGRGQTNSSSIRSALDLQGFPPDRRWRDPLPQHQVQAIRIAPILSLE